MPSLATDFTSLAGIDLPIVQAPIGSGTTPELAAAVSNAGGLGMLSLTWRSPNEARELIRQTRALTDRPFGINLILLWDATERLSIALEEGVPVISLSWGDPTPWVEQIHDAGALLVHMVGSTAEAIAAKLAGVDVIVAQGYEASGHVEGQTGIMALLPEMADAVAPTPVLAAGGIGHGRGLAAALCLGASGVWMGTRFLLSSEADAHPDYQGWLVEANASGTVFTTIFRGGWPPNTPRALCRTGRCSSGKKRVAPKRGADRAKVMSSAKPAEAWRFFAITMTFPAPAPPGTSRAWCCMPEKVLG